MGRRLVGGALVAVGLIAASLAWAAFSLTRTVLDPDRSERIADAVYDDPAVRSYLGDAMVAAASPFIDAGASRGDVDAAARRALDNPTVEEAMIGGLVRAHQRFLGEDPRPDEPIVVDASALAAATRRELVNTDPELLGGLPEVPSFAVILPTESMPSVGGARTTVVGAVAFLALVAVGLVVAAFVVTDNRARVLRRVGFWAIGAAAFWVVVGVVIPSLAHLLLPDEATVVASLWGVGAAGMVQPSLVAAGAGVAALVLSLIWMLGSAVVARGDRRRARNRSEPAGRSRRAVAGSGPRRTSVASAAAGQHSGPRVPRGARPVDPVDAYTARGHARPAGGAAASAAPIRTPGPATPPRGVPVVPADPPRSQPAPRWVEGVGYVDDPET